MAKKQTEIDRQVKAAAKALDELQKKQAEEKLAQLDKNKIKRLIATYKRLTSKSHTITVKEGPVTVEVEIAAEGCLSLEFDVVECDFQPSFKNKELQNLFADRDVLCNISTALEGSICDYSEWLIQSVRKHCRFVQDVLDFNKEMEQIEPSCLPALEDRFRLLK